MFKRICTYIKNKFRPKVFLKMTPGYEHLLPMKAHKGDAGYDLRAAISEPVIIPPGEVKLISVGFSCAIPEGYEIQIRPRSGLALNNYISVLNTPGTIDSNYRGLVMVILFNFGKYDYKVEPFDRIAQAVICKLPDVEIVNYSTVTAELKEFWNNQQKISERGSKGFGSSGKR